MLGTLRYQRILVTRETSQADVFSQRIKAYDGIPVKVPLLNINCIPFEQALKLSAYEWIFFTSANGVKCFFERVLNKNEVINTCKIAVVGKKTEQALNKYGYHANFIPSMYNANVMANEFLRTYTNPGRILLVRGNRSRNVLPKVLATHHVNYDSLEVYRTTKNDMMKDELNKQLLEGCIHFITFMSPSAVDAFIDMVDPNIWNQIKNQIVSVCIGTTTEKRAHEKEILHTIIPHEFTIEGMIKRMSQYIYEKRID